MNPEAGPTLTMLLPESQRKLQPAWAPSVMDFSPGGRTGCLACRVGVLLSGKGTAAFSESS